MSLPPVPPASWPACERLGRWLRAGVAALLVLAAGALPSRALLGADGSQAQAPNGAYPWAPSPTPPVPVGTLELNPFPVVFYTPETRTGYGVGAWVIARPDGRRTDTPPDNIWVSAVHTQERQTILRAIPELYFGGGRVRLQMRLRYQAFPTRFYGIGNDTPASAEEPYTPVTHAVQVTFTQRTFGTFSLGARAAYDHTEIARTAPGGQLATGSVPGAQGSRLGGLGLVLRRDRREQHFSPRSGSLLQVTVLRYKDLDGAPWRFTDTAVDLRRYVSLPAGQVLALRLLGQSIAGAAPFTALPRLGGKFVMRGLYEGRYRDKNLLVLQAEHRLPLGGRWAARAFVSAGDVAPRPRAIALADFKAAGGLGLRYAYSRRERINVRFDLAYARGSRGVYFSVGEAF